MKVVFLLIGVPGSGKSTFVQKTILEFGVSNNTVCSADHFFMKGGWYKFDGSKLGQAHKECAERFRWAVENNVELIFVDDTNINPAHRKPYIDLAEEHGYTVYQKFIRVDSQVAFERNVHGVPLESIKRMNESLLKEFGDSNVSLDSVSCYRNCI